MPKCAAKQLILILIYGGSISTWRTEHNIPDAVELPAIGSEIKCTVDDNKEMSISNSDNTMVIKAAKIKQHHRGKPWENTVLSL